MKEIITQRCAFNLDSQSVLCHSSLHTVVQGKENDTMSATALSQSYAKLPARHVERARAFYADKLNLSPFGENSGHLFYELGGSHFMVYPSGGAASGTHDQIGFVVEDVEATVARLRSNGVIFEEYEPPQGASASDGIMDFGGVKAAWFKDSEGNLLSVVEFASGSPFAARSESGVQASSADMTVRS
jgi:predicted enzyme related to lactoylglutathione lyase